MSDRLRELIGDGHAHALDGAMGTMLYAKGVFVNVCYDQLNLTQPELVQELHEAYVRAGAEIIETNTFGANPVKLSSFGLEDRTEEINAAAGRLARAAANGRAAIVGAVGPLGVRIEPFGPTGRDEAFGFFRRQAEGLLEGFVDGFILETFSDMDELQAAYRAIRSLTDAPVIAQMTVGEDGNTSYGTSVETIFSTVSKWGADVLGLNCSVGPAAMLDALERAAEVTDRPLSAQPNAGLPKAVGDRKIYLASPEYMASYARRMIAAGARFVGGCCGTTPDHIRVIRDVVAGSTAARASSGVRVRASEESPGVEPVPLAQRSRWGGKLARGEFVTCLEVTPPKGWVASDLLAQCRAARIAGVDAVHVLDGPRTQSRMSAIPSAIIVEREAGLETLVHYSCRDRNMLGMIGDLLGAAGAGLRNLFLVTGDPPKTGPYPDATAVFDIDSIGLTNVASRLNRGLDPGGNPIGDPTRFVIGAGVNPGAADRERELSRFAWKVDAGAEYAVTRPVFDPRQLESFLEAIEEFRIPIIVGIWPITSVRNAEYLANEVPGVDVPPSVLERMRRRQDDGDAAMREEGIAIARELLETLRSAVQGVQISTSSGRVDAALEVLAGIGVAR